MSLSGGSTAVDLGSKSMAVLLAFGKQCFGLLAGSVFEGVRKAVDVWFYGDKKTAWYSGFEGYMV